MFMYVHVCTSVRTYVYMYIYTYINTNLQTYVLTTYVCINVCMYIVNIQLLDYYLAYTETRLSYSLIFLYIIKSDSRKHDNDH